MKVNTMPGHLKNLIFRNKLTIRLLYVLGFYGNRFRKKYNNFTLSDEWRDRINKVCECPDNKSIPKATALLATSPDICPCQPLIALPASPFQLH